MAWVFLLRFIIYAPHNAFLFNFLLTGSLFGLICLRILISRPTYSCWVRFIRFNLCISLPLFRLFWFDTFTHFHEQVFGWRYTHHTSRSSFLLRWWFSWSNCSSPHFHSPQLLLSVCDKRLWSITITFYTNSFCWVSWRHFFPLIWQSWRLFLCSGCTCSRSTLHLLCFSSMLLS